MTKNLIALALLAVLAAGCSAVDKLTGQTDDTVLPGQREDAVPGKAKFPQQSDAAPAPSTQAETAATAPEPAEPCAADDATCAAPPDGTFNDPQ